MALGAGWLAEESRAFQYARPAIFFCSFGGAGIPRNESTPFLNSQPQTETYDTVHLITNPPERSSPASRYRTSLQSEFGAFFLAAQVVAGITADLTACGQSRNPAGHSLSETITRELRIVPDILATIHLFDSSEICFRKLLNRTLRIRGHELDV